MLGHLAELSSQELRADTLFMGIGAISPEQGLMNDSVPEILTDRALRRMSRTVVVLADASKFEQVAPGYVFGLDEVDLVITDARRAGRRWRRSGARGRGRGGGGPGPRRGQGRGTATRVRRQPVATEPGDDRGRRPAPRSARARTRSARRSSPPATTPARSPASWLTAGVRRVHVIGNGTSYHSSLAAATLYRHHAGPDDPVVVPTTAAEFLVYPPVLGPRDAVVGISSSGEFKDVVAVAAAVRGRIPMAGIVHVPGSTLDEGRVRHRPVGRRPVGRPGHDEDVLLDPRRDRAPAPRAARRRTRQPPGRRRSSSPLTPPRPRSPPPSRWSSRSPRRSRTRGTSS